MITEFAMQHPYLFTIIVIFVIIGLAHAITQVANAWAVRKAQPKIVVVNDPTKEDKRRKDK